ncbi:TetR family transcriptional regulator [Cellulophaga geojensis KL-A]|uniref:TetR family transcriptional regulator n=1 Tax=Cellulophaga geojensis KL-A TaxID=1328323 RepID=A0ABN0RR95_9FLAO|nr:MULTISPECIES: TetR/AcrR family transcriptional regulator [Cellulophaga]AIM60292.1 TetR family transcriptional regulator [Cellulophaga lytica]EWH14469.1 TetR family transcriptional regulator [Cellulophaga geojensis KL-A]
MNKKETILKAALELLVENGIHATPVSAIAKKANTGMGTIYNYFESKEVLINAIYVAIKEEEKKVLDTVFNNDLPVKIQFEKYYTIVIEFFTKNKLYFGFMDQLQASPIITNESKSVGYNAIEGAISLLVKGKNEHIIKNIDNDELLQFIGGSILSYLRWINLPDHNNKSLKNQITLVWDAIKE